MIKSTTIRRTSFAACAALVLGAASAHAVTVNFNFTTPQPDAAFFLYSDAGTGLQLTVTPGLFTLSPTVITPGFEVTQTGSGLGVEGTNTDAQPQIDAKQGLTELAIFSFNDSVSLNTIAFQNVDTADTMRFFYDVGNDNDLDDFGTDQAIKNPPDNILDLITTYTLVNVTGDLFGFGANCVAGNNDPCVNNEWRIVSLSLTYDKISPVPLPAALPLLGAGLAGLGFMGWVKRRKDAKLAQAA